MYLYFLFIRIAALFGHRKARLLVRGLKAQRGKVSGHEGAVWIHAASVGEFEQVRPLIERLRREQPRKPIVLTFFSPSGYELRKNYDQVDAVYYLPFATRRNARRFINALLPSMAIFVKYEFWPAYLHELKKREIPTYSISAIFRPKQIFFSVWGKSQLKALRCFTHIYVQDEASRRLLAEHGVHHSSVVGDTRFDRVEEIKQSAHRLPLVEQFVDGAKHVLIAGSTWPEDEELLKKYMGHRSLENGHLSTKLILVPHEINEAHLHYIFQLFKGRFVRYSDMEQMGDAVSRYNILQRAEVLVVNQLGLLSSLYAYGHAAYIGGGFGAGIHNTIEAAVYGLPVVFGPKYHHFREAQGLIDVGAAKSFTHYCDLESAMDTALNQHTALGTKAAEYVQVEKGATEKIYADIFANN